MYVTDDSRPSSTNRAETNKRKLKLKSSAVSARIGSRASSNLIGTPRTLRCSRVLFFWSSQCEGELSSTSFPRVTIRRVSSRRSERASGRTDPRRETSSGIHARRQRPRRLDMSSVFRNGSTARSAAPEPPLIDELTVRGEEPLPMCIFNQSRTDPNAIDAAHAGAAYLHGGI